MYKYLKMNTSGYYELSEEIFKNSSEDKFKVSYSIIEKYLNRDNYENTRETEHGFIYGKTEEELRQKAIELYIGNNCGKLGYIWQQKYNYTYIDYDNKLEINNFENFIFNNDLEVIEKKYSPYEAEIRDIDFGVIELITKYEPTIKLYNTIKDDIAIIEAAIDLSKK